MAGDESDAFNRRHLLAGAGLTVLAAANPRAAGAAATSVPPIDEGVVKGDDVDFPSIVAPSERPAPPLLNADPPSRRVGFAIMGLGRLALGEILPAFADCKHARPVALISGDPDKSRAVAAQYGISADACYDYRSFDRVRDNPAIEVVYVVTPNALHRDNVVAAAKAGKHVLCEKPMATSPDEAREMISACRAADRLLMIAYRIQYETYNTELARRARAGELGSVRLISAVNVQNQGDPRQWRQIKAIAGGGALPDIGLYCLNTARALLGEEPVEVFATEWRPSDDPRFEQVEASIAFTLKFPSGAIATCSSSYAAHERRDFAVYGSDAAAHIENAFAYEGQRLIMARRDGRAENVTTVSLPQRKQFALEIDHMAACVRSGTRPRTPGEEGLQDQVLMAAIYESARAHRPVSFPAVAGVDVFRGAMPKPAS
jgi:predicted dehydrogenase